MSETAAPVTFTLEDLKNMMKGNDHYEVVNFPGTEHKVAMKVLSQREIDMAYAAAELKFMKDDKYKELNFRGTSAFTREAERQMMYHAVVEVPADPEEQLRRFFNSADDIGLLDTTYSDALVEKYFQVQAKYDPSTKLQNEEQLMEVLEDVKKNSAIGLHLSTLELAMLVDFLVKNPEILQKVNGSSSQPSKSEKTNSKPKNSTVELKIQD